ncbi:putative Sushi/SCR/CCP domain-containing protein [Plasmopara halstedii]
MQHIVYYELFAIAFYIGSLNLLNTELWYRSDSIRTSRPAIALAVVCVPIEAAYLRGNASVSNNCSAPVPIYQGLVKYSSTAPGSTATYSCMRGTTMKGSATIHCSNYGSWSPQPPECRVTYNTSKDNTFKNHDTGYLLYSG